MSDFKRGDSVILKGGGPYMTVTGSRIGDVGYGDEDIYHCIWFDAQARLQLSEFAGLSLRSAFDADGNLVTHYVPSNA